jgi:hypothetical protein
VFVEDLHADKHITEVSTRWGIGGQRVVELFLSGQIALQQDLLQPTTGTPVGRGRVDSLSNLRTWLDDILYCLAILATTSLIDRHDATLIVPR